MRTAIFSALTLVLGGCATHAGFEKLMGSYMGNTEAQLVGRLGPPQGSYRLDDGSRVLQYTRGGAIVLAGARSYAPVTTNTTGNVTLNDGMRQTTGTYNQRSTTYVSQQAPDTAIALNCTVNFTVSPDGFVYAWRASGNNCIAR